MADVLLTPGEERVRKWGARKQKEKKKGEQIFFLALIIFSSYF